MQAVNSEWSQTEDNIAQTVLKRAYEREIGALMEQVRAQAGSIAKIEDMWSLHDFLSARRHEIDGKDDSRESGRLFVFARLLKEGWLQLDELEGLDRGKITKISVLARM
ncbi:MAG: hypothetical protein ACRC11_00745 [Xenococcaceae cyanobacterium]